jgi:hypothetical protein
MSRVSHGHVRNLVPDSGRNEHAQLTSVAWLSGALVPFGHGRYLVPAVSRGAK